MKPQAAPSLLPSTPSGYEYRLFRYSRSSITVAFPRQSAASKERRHASSEFRGHFNRSATTSATPPSRSPGANRASLAPRSGGARLPPRQSLRPPSPRRRASARLARYRLGVVGTSFTSRTSTPFARTSGRRAGIGPALGRISGERAVLLGAAGIGAAVRGRYAVGGRCPYRRIRQRYGGGAQARAKTHSQVSGGDSRPRLAPLLADLVRVRLSPTSCFALSSPYAIRRQPPRSTTAPPQSQPRRRA